MHMACILLLIMLSLIALAPFLEFIFSLEYVYIVNHCGLYENSIEMIVRDKYRLSQDNRVGPLLDFAPANSSKQASRCSCDPLMSIRASTMSIEDLVLSKRHQVSDPNS